MELRQLAYFVAIVEEGSFTRAAAREHVAQPGVSAQIRLLERELGQPLLDRSGRTVRPTDVGVAVLPYARAALAAVDGVRLAVDELTGLLRGRVAVGMVTAPGPLGIPALLAAFHREHSGVEITLAEGNSDELVRGLREGGLDAAVIGVANEVPAGLALQVVTDERLAGVVSPEDPLAGRPSVRLAEIHDRPLISLPVGTGLRACLDRACATIGVTPHVAFEAGDPLMLADLAAQGLGLAIVPESLAKAQGDRLARVTIGEPPLRSQLALGWRAEGPTSPAARALLTHLRAGLPTAAPTD